MILLLLFSVLARNLGCVIHEEYLGYTNISDLGVAAIDNNDLIVEDILKSGCEVNYNGTVFIARPEDLDYGDEYDYEYDYDEYEDYYDENKTTYEYGYDDYEDYFDENITIFRGLSPLHLACNYDSLEFVKKMLEIPGIEVDLVTSEGMTPMHECVIFGSTEIVRLLNSHGADVNHRDYYGRTPISIAASWAELGTVEALYELGADVNIPDHEGATPVYMAASYGHFEMVKRLHEMGADLDAVFIPAEDTALMLATVGGYELIVEYLVNAGVNRDAVDIDGMSALDYARLYGLEDIVDILLSEGKILIL